MAVDQQRAAYTDPFVAEAQRRPQDGPTPDEPQGDAKPACGRKGCYLPWADHLTKKGDVRAAYRGHQLAGEGTGSRTFDRAKIRRAMGRGKARPSLAARRKAPASFATHVMVVDSGGNRRRMTLEDFAAALDAAKQRQS